MFSVVKSAVPPNTMLGAYLKHGSYVDCYSTEVPVRITLCEFIYSFYTTSLFRLERAILGSSVSKPSTDDQVRQLADGNIETFAAWNVEDRGANEILMCDVSGRTRSWLMVVPASGSRTILYFGSAVVPVRDSKTGQRSLGAGFQALLGFHKIYSVLLLYSAKSRIERRYLPDGTSTI